jgi:carbonic anhydrase
MPSNHLSRRDLIAAAGIVAAGLAASSCKGPDAPELPPEPRPLDGAEARLRLEAGNRRFMEGTTRHAHESANWRKMLTADQHPFATLLCCSDSRVPPELVFDQGFGELFVIRVAGNVIDTDILGSIQYAVRHLHTHLVVVMGHEGCGAVGAAMAALGGKNDEPAFITALVERIEPGIADLPTDLDADARYHAAVEANVRWGLRQITEIAAEYPAEEQESVTMLGAVYELATGKVRFLE